MRFDPYDRSNMTTTRSPLLLAIVVGTCFASATTGLAQSELELTSPQSNRLTSFQPSEIESVESVQNQSRDQDRALGEKIADGRQEIERLEIEASEVDEMLADVQSALQTATSGVMSISVDVARAEQKYEALSASIRASRGEIPSR